MSISMHSASAPIFLRTFNAMLNWLDKAQAHAEARKFDTANYLGLRLAPDMLPFTRQIQIATDGVKGCMARLAGVAPITASRALKTLRARIRKAIAYVQSFEPAQIDGTDDKEVLLPQRQGDPMRFTGEAYLKHYVLPNLYFHATMTYALLRHACVDVGKRDFLAG